MMVSDQVVDDAVDVKVQQNCRLFTVDEHVATLRIPEQAEVHVVVAVLTENPTNDLTRRRTRQTKHVIDLVEEEMPTRLEKVVRVSLLNVQEDTVVLSARVPVRVELVEEPCIDRSEEHTSELQSRENLV